LNSRGFSDLGRAGVSAFAETSALTLGIYLGWLGIFWRWEPGDLHKNEYFEKQRLAVATLAHF
jgi:hypothetical protein